MHISVQMCIHMYPGHMQAGSKKAETTSQHFETAGADASGRKIDYTRSEKVNIDAYEYGYMNTNQNTHLHEYIYIYIHTHIRTLYTHMYMCTDMKATVIFSEHSRKNPSTRPNPTESAQATKTSNKRN